MYGLSIDRCIVVDPKTAGITICKTPDSVHGSATRSVHRNAFIVSILFKYDSGLLTATQDWGRTYSVAPLSPIVRRRWQDRSIVVFFGIVDGQSPPKRSERKGHEPHWKRSSCGSILLRGPGRCRL